MTLTPEQLQRMQMNSWLAKCRRTLQHNQKCLSFLTDVVDVVGKHNPHFLTCGVKYSLKQAKEKATLANHVLTPSTTNGTNNNKTPTAMAPNFHLPQEDYISPPVPSSGHSKSAESPAHLASVFSSMADDVATHQAYLVAAANQSIKEHALLGDGPGIFYNDRRDDQHIAFRTIFNLEISSHNRYDVNFPPRVMGKTLQHTPVCERQPPNPATKPLPLLPKIKNESLGEQMVTTVPKITHQDQGTALKSPLNFVSGPKPNKLPIKKLPVFNPYAKPADPETQTCFQDHINKKAKMSSTMTATNYCSLGTTRVMILYLTRHTAPQAPTLAPTLGPSKNRHVK